MKKCTNNIFLNDLDPCVLSTRKEGNWKKWWLWIPSVTGRDIAYFYWRKTGLHRKRTLTLWQVTKMKRNNEKILRHSSGNYISSIFDSSRSYEAQIWGWQAMLLFLCTVVGTAKPSDGSTLIAFPVWLWQRALGYQWAA